MFTSISTYFKPPTGLLSGSKATFMTWAKKTTGTDGARYIFSFAISSNDNYMLLSV